MKLKSIYLVCFLSTLFIPNLYSETIDEYYATAQGKTGESLKNALHDKIRNQKVLSYSEVWDALKITDEDPNNTNNVILLYTGWSYPKTINGGDATDWNREHTWAKSIGNFGTSNGPGTDIHHLRPTDVTVNSKRGNLYFDNGGTEYTDGTRYGGGDGTTGCKYDSDSWEPRDEVKGDVARMLFYMATRYESIDMVDLELAETSSTSGLHGKLSTLLEWHKNDPVDDWERERNEKIYGIQNNRNPYIDHPEYVDLIWGENTGGNGGTGGNENPIYTDIFSEDFEGTDLGKMSSYNSIGNGQTWYQSSNNGNYFAKMSGYENSEYFENEDWLINSEPINLYGYQDINLSFITMMKVYDGETSLKIMISSDYDGNSDPNSFNWTDITSNCNLSTDNYAVVSSGEINLDKWELKSIYLAFKFESSNRGSNTWNIDEISITGKTATNIYSATKSGYLIYPNPATDYIKIASKTISDVSIFSCDGKIIKQIPDYSPNNVININTLNKGIYIIKFKDDSYNTYTEKIIIK